MIPSLHPTPQSVPYQEVKSGTCAFCDDQFVVGELVFLYEENGVVVLAFCYGCGRRLTLRPGTHLLHSIYEGEC